MVERIQDSLNSSSNSIITNNRNIEEILKCFICFEKVIDAKLCPSCSKLCCNSCIIKWLSKKPECPHCRSPLRHQNLVNGRIVSEISQALESLQVSKPEPIEKCAAHSTPLSYYCLTCLKAVCSDCAMFGLEHKNHEFQRLSTVHEKHVEIIKHESQILRRRIWELSSILQEIDLNIAKVKKSNEEKSNELISSVQQMQERLDSELENRLQVLNKQKETLSEEIDHLENMHIKISKQLINNAKSKLIAKTPRIIKTLKELHLAPLPPLIPVPSEFPSEIIPNYDSEIFEINHYTVLRSSTEVVYSKILQSDGVSWRLKVYPNGNGVARDSYLSVFIEMIKGFQYSSKYEYRIEMANHLSSNLCVARENTSEFEPGECWGYNRFFKIQLLKEEGYLNEEDTILLRFFVRATTYSQKCRDQKHYINYLEASKNNLQEQLKNYKEKCEKNASVLDSDENPLEKIEEENLEEEKDGEEIGKEDELGILQKQIEIEWKVKNEGEEVKKVSRDELNTVLQRYMMTPEEVSSLSSESAEDCQEFGSRSCSDILLHDLLDPYEPEISNSHTNSEPFR
ncbi:unnamed protein product [Blepharisma stoltei]|uniref:Uncharacterized protein n=1 Tax=Blepharisma stoltei TaxID=1481888 RepID=A0AAU9K7T6_9CILI|nr:unnamed protein product [Blepharisma stoltei]